MFLVAFVGDYCELTVIVTLMMYTSIVFSFVNYCPRALDLLTTVLSVMYYSRLHAEP